MSESDGFFATQIDQKRTDDPEQIEESPKQKQKLPPI